MTSAAPAAASAGAAHASVRVSASSANLGAGYDCIGLAVDRWLEASVTSPVADGDDAAAAATGVTVARGGELAALREPDGRRDLLYVGFAAACAARGRPVPPRLAFTASSDIPVARGLGSSAAAVVAGVRLADRLLALALDDHAVATIATTVEGHPDNVAPSVFGGLVLSVRDDAAHGGGHLFVPLAVHPSLGFAFAVPDFETSTAAARQALPASLPHGVAVAAAAKGAALVHGLESGHPGLLRAALDDVLHVPFRKGRVPGYDAVVAAALAAGAHGATLSGSGSTLVAVGPRERMRAVSAAMCSAWHGVGVSARPIVDAGPR
jgi:homoserine kinase